MALTASIAVLEFESPKRRVTFKGSAWAETAEKQKNKIKKITYSGT